MQVDSNTCRSCKDIGSEETSHSLWISFPIKRKRLLYSCTLDSPCEVERKTRLFQINGMDLKHTISDITLQLVRLRTNIVTKPHLYLKTQLYFHLIDELNDFIVQKENSQVVCLASLRDLCYRSLISKFVLKYIINFVTYSP